VSLTLLKGTTTGAALNLVKTADNITGKMRKIFINNIKYVYKGAHGSRSHSVVTRLAIMINPPKFVGHIKVGINQDISKVISH